MPSIRIIAGTYGGRKIEAPSTDNRRIHPMGERIRNAIFNSIGTSIAEANVLDAFAGTGAIGLEALSRGANHATFIEKDRVAQRILSSNIDLLGVGESTKLIRTSVANWCDTYDGQPFAYIFADPPYYDTQEGSLQRLQKIVAPGGRLVVSWPEQAELPDFSDLNKESERVYAGAKIAVYKKIS